MDAIFKAVFTNFKPITTRKVLQITLEAPLEQGDLIIQMLGMPNPETSKWVAVARIDDKISGGNASLTAAPEGELVSPPAPIRRKWSEMTRAEKAGLLCSRKEFQEYTQSKTPEEAAQAIRLYCGVQSRTMIDASPASQEQFDELEGGFQVWSHERQRGRL